MQRLTVSHHFTPQAPGRKASCPCSQGSGSGYLHPFWKLLSQGAMDVYCIPTSSKPVCIVRKEGKKFNNKELKTKQRLDEKLIEVNEKTPAGFTEGWIGSLLQTSETNAKFV